MMTKCVRQNVNRISSSVTVLLDMVHLQWNLQTLIIYDTVKKKVVDLEIS